MSRTDPGDRIGGFDGKCRDLRDSLAELPTVVLRYLPLVTSNVSTANSVSIGEPRYSGTRQWLSRSVRSSLSVARGRLPISNQTPHAAVAKLVHEIDTWRPDVLHIEGIDLLHLGRDRNLLRKVREVGAVSILSISDSYSLLYGANGGGCLEAFLTRARRRVIRRIERLSYRNVDEIHVVSERDANWVREFSRTRVAVIPLGSVAPIGQVSIKTPHTLGYCGSLGGTFGKVFSDFLVKVWPIVVEAVPDAQLVVGGAGVDGDLETLLQSSRNTEYLGVVSTCGEVLSSASIALVPSNQRAGTPTKALEAMAYGCAVIGGEALFGLDGATNGTEFVATQTFDEFAQALISVLTSPDRTAQLQSKGRTFQATRLWTHSADIYLREIGHLSPLGH